MNPIARYAGAALVSLALGMLVAACSGEADRKSVV